MIDMVIHRDNSQSSEADHGQSKIADRHIHSEGKQGKIQPAHSILYMSAMLIRDRKQRTFSPTLLITPPYKYKSTLTKCLRKYITHKFVWLVTL